MSHPPQPHEQPYGQPQQPYPGQQYPPPGSYPTQPPGPRKSVTKRRGLSGKSHTFHLVMTICTCTLWGWFVWLPMWIFRMFVRRKEVTKYHY